MGVKTEDGVGAAKLAHQAKLAAEEVLCDVADGVIDKDRVYLGGTGTVRDGPVSNVNEGGPAGARAKDGVIGLLVRSCVKFLAILLVFKRDGDSLRL